jgi:hypothetical protein
VTPAGRHDISQEPGTGALTRDQKRVSPDVPWFHAVVVGANGAIPFHHLASPATSRAVRAPAGRRTASGRLGPELIAATLLSLVVPRGGALALNLLLTYGTASDHARLALEFLRGRAKF